MQSIFRPVLADAAVAYAMLAQGLSFIASIATTILIIAFFSPALQGYYYTFSSLIGLQAFMILGIGQVLQQFVSHQWARLRLNSEGRITGEPEAVGNIAGLAEFTLRWYAAMGILISIVLSASGYVFIHYTQKGHPSPEVFWMLPWFLLCFATAGNLFVSAGFVFLEGCNQVLAIRKFRGLQVLFHRGVQWLAIVLGGKLWVFPISVLASISVALIFFTKKYRCFFVSLFETKNAKSIHWKKDIRPVQWRFAVTSISRFFLFSTLTPIMFALHGPATAGRFGVTWALLNMASGFSFTFISTKIPAIAMTAASRDTRKTDRLYRIHARSAMISMALCCIAIWAGIALLYQLNLEVADRFLRPLPAALFVMAAFLQHGRNTAAAYVLAHKKEPFWWVGILEGTLAVSLFFYLAGHYDVLGAVFGFLGLSTVSLILVVWIAADFRKRLYLRADRAGSA